MNQLLQQLLPALNKEDYNGNKLTMNPDTGVILFHPVGEPSRNIGLLKEEDGKIWYEKVEDEQHIHRKTFGWSINVEVADHCDHIKYTTPDTTYSISRTDARNHAVRQREEGRPSLDRKWYVPIRHWTITSANRRKQTLIDRMGFEWYWIMKEEFDKPYMENLNAFLSNVQSEVFPPTELYFNAFRLTPFMDTKVVILGQDPYHTSGVAHGLAFSSASEDYVPPSLKNIFQEIENDVYSGLIMFQDPDLTRWASQGVLLLNTILTVESGKAASHEGRGWEQFTSRAIQQINDKLNGIVFLLWGSYAQSFSPMIDTSKHHVFTAPHPSPLSAHRGFFGCKHFSKTNAVLAKHNKIPIVW